MPSDAETADLERFCHQPQPPWYRPRVAAAVIGAALWSFAGYAAAQFLFARSESGIPAWWWIALAIPTAAFLLLALYFRITEIPKPDPNRHIYNPHNLYSAPPIPAHDKSRSGQDGE